MSEQGRGYERSFAGMVGAMIVLVLVVLGFVGFQQLTNSNPPTPVPAVGYAREAAYARGQASFPLVAPSKLPAGWKATSVSFAPGPKQHWHLGCLTDAGRYVGLEQGDQPSSAMVAQYVGPSPSRAAPVRVGGISWAAYTSSNGDLGLVHTQGATTTLVVGHEVSRDELARFAASLKRPT